MKIKKKSLFDKRDYAVEVQNTFMYQVNEIPYYKFIYKRNLIDIILKKQKGRRYYFSDGTYLPQYIGEETKKQFNFENNDFVTFDKAMIVIIHAFDDIRIPRDLDNYHYKPFIDVIRKLQIVSDDSWQEVALNTIGILEEEERIEIFVVPFSYYPEFINSNNRLKTLFNEDINVERFISFQQRQDELNDTLKYLV